MAVTTTLTPFPNPAPNIQTQSQEVFSQNADSAFSHLITEFPDINAVGDEINLTAVEVNNNAVIASQQATIATDKAAIAVDSATNALNNWNDFQGVYYGSLASEPTTDPLGNAMGKGDLYYNSTTNEINSFDGVNWVVPKFGATAGFRAEPFTATSGQTVFTVAGGYSPAAATVFKNGAKLIAGVDVDLTSGTTFTLTVGAVATDVFDFLGFGSFDVADTYSMAQIDTKDAQSTLASVSGPYMTYGGSANAITLTSVNKAADTAYIVGAQYRFRATATNAGIATVSVDGLPVVTIKTITGVDLPAGYIRTDVDTVGTYDGINFITDRQIEHGSNANGEFRRLADGRLEMSVIGVTLPYLSGNRLGYTWTFPIATIDITYIVQFATESLSVANTASYGNTVWIDSKATTSGRSSLICNSYFATSDTAVADLSLTGRWY